MAVVVGVGMGSAVVWRVWVTVGADDTRSICVDPKLLLNMGEGMKMCLHYLYLGHLWCSKRLQCLEG